MKEIYLVQKHFGSDEPTRLKIVNNEAGSFVYFKECGDLTNKWTILGTLDKTTKRGWTVNTFWLTSKLVQFFVPREDFTETEVEPKK